MTREQRRISPRDRVLGNAAGVIAEGDVHEDSSAGGVEAHHESFGILAAFGAVVRGVHVRRVNAEVEALIVQSGDSVADDLVSEFADGFADQVVGLRQFGAGHTTGDFYGRLGIEIENNPALDFAGEADLSGDAFTPVGLFFHAQVLDGGRPL